MARRSDDRGRNKRKKPRPSASTKTRTAPRQSPIQRLIASIKAVETSLAHQSNPPGPQIAVILAEFRQKLDGALTSARAPAPKGPQLTAAQKTSKAIATEPPPKPAEIERERIYTLDRIAGGVAKQIVVREQIDDSVDPEDIVYRVGCLELADDEPWTWVDGSIEGDAIRTYFPDDLYYGFPPFLDLERPRKPQVGQTWRLRRTDGVTAASFVLRSIDLSERPRPQWKHGDIVRADYDGKSFIARFIRITENGQALVHWGVDGTFSAIAMDDVIESSTKRWTRDLEAEDVEVEF